MHPSTIKQVLAALALAAHLGLSAPTGSDDVDSFAFDEASVTAGIEQTGITERSEGTVVHANVELVENATPAHSSPAANPAPLIPRIVCARTEVRHKGLGAWIIMSEHWPALVNIITSEDGKKPKAFKKYMNSSGCKFLLGKKSAEHYHNVTTQEAQQYFELKPKQDEAKFMSCISTWLKYVGAPTDLCEPEHLVPNPFIQDKKGHIKNPREAALKTVGECRTTIAIDAPAAKSTPTPVASPAPLDSHQAENQARAVEVSSEAE